VVVWLAESGNEKMIRFGFIGVAIVFVVIGFYFTTGKSNVKQEVGPLQSDIHVQVLTRAGQNQNPIIIVAKPYNGQQLLIKYEVQIENQFYLKVLESISLNSIVKELLVHDSEIWVRTERERLLFSRNLDVLKQVKNFPSSIKEMDNDFQIIETNPVIVELTDQHHHTFTIELSGRKQPQAIESLSVEHSIWLIVYKDNFQIANGT
jgi:hypothetical protein